MRVICSAQDFLEQDAASCESLATCVAMSAWETEVSHLQIWASRSASETGARTRQ